jgi:hypothetical protein
LIRQDLHFPKLKESPGKLAFPLSELRKSAEKTQETASNRKNNAVTYFISVKIA